MINHPTRTKSHMRFENMPAKHVKLITPRLISIWTSRTQGNHAGDGSQATVANAHEHSQHAECLRDSKRASRQLDGGYSKFIRGHLDVVPRDIAREPSTKRLGRCFLGSDVTADNVSSTSAHAELGNLIWREPSSEQVIIPRN